MKIEKCTFCKKEAKTLYVGSHNVYKRGTDRKVTLCKKCFDVDLELAHLKIKLKDQERKSDKKLKKEFGKFHQIHGNIYLKI